MDEKEQQNMVENLLAIMRTMHPHVVIEQLPLKERERREAAEDRRLNLYEEEITRNAKLNVERLKIEHETHKAYLQELAHVQAYRDKTLEISAKQAEALSTIAKHLEPVRVSSEPVRHGIA